MKKIESLLKIACMKFEFQNLQIRFHTRQVSFLVFKTVMCKRGIRLVSAIICCKLSGTMFLVFLTDSHVSKVHLLRSSTELRVFLGENFTTS